MKRLLFLAESSLLAKSAIRVSLQQETCLKQLRIAGCQEKELHFLCLLLKVRAGLASIINSRDFFLMRTVMKIFRFTPLLRKTHTLTKYSARGLIWLHGRG